MSYQVIQNFNGGLDTRKFFLSLPPGTLTELINGHITQGGEIEKRKQFALTALPSGTGYTFGGQETDSGIVIFGSAASGTVGSLPSPFIYQQLVYPANGSAASGSQAMTALVWSTTFGSGVFAIAEFADNSTWAFYNGVVIPDFFDGGRSINFTSQATISASMVAIINAGTSATGYSATQHGSPNQNVFDVVTKAGSNFTPAITLNTSAGTLTDVFNNAAIAPVPGSVASGSFQVIAGQPAYATGALTFGGQPTNGQTVTINGVIYHFVSSIGSTAGNVLIDTSAANTASNLFNAINGDAGAGTKYIATATSPNAYVTATISGTVITLQSIITGSGGNAYTLAKSGTYPSLSGATLTGGDASALTSAVVGASANLLNGGTQIDFGGDVGITAAAVAASINASSVAASAGYSANSNGGVVSIVCTADGVTANGLNIVTTAKGTVCVGNCQFSLTGGYGSGGNNGSNGFQVTSIVANGVTLCGTISWPQTVAQTLTQFMQAVVSLINGNSATTGYLAAYDASLIYISKQVSSSADSPLLVDVNITNIGTGAGQALNAPSSGIQFTLDNYTVSSTYNKTNKTFTTTPTVNVVGLSGGVAPYTYSWAFSPIGSNWPHYTTGNTDDGLVTFTPQVSASGSMYCNAVAATTNDGTLQVSAVLTITDVNGATGTSSPVIITI